MAQREGFKEWLHVQKDSARRTSSIEGGYFSSLYAARNGKYLTLLDRETGNTFTLIKEELEAVIRRLWGE